MKRYSLRRYGRIAPLLVPLLLAGCVTNPEREPGSEAVVDSTEVPAVCTATSNPPEFTPPSLLLAAPIGHGGGNKTQTQHPTDLWDRVRLGFRLTAPDGPRIRRELAWLTANPDSLELGAKRAEPYLHFIVEETERRGMPLEIALLPALESGFRPNARSPREALGLWQFIPSTAKAMGLKQNWWYEGRCDITASTRAALDYLQILAEQFDGDWELALAAYNAGPGTVQQAIRSNQAKGLATDFWSLPLPDETRKYVPRLLAMARIMGHPDAHGVELKPLADEPYFSAVDLPYPMDLRQAARLAQVDRALLGKLNPGLRHGTTGPHGGYSLLLPVEQASRFEQRLAHLDPRQWAAPQQYQVRRGDTLTQIARRLGISSRILQEANGLRSRRLRSGQKLVVPLTADRGPLLADANTAQDVALDRDGSKPSTPAPAPALKARTTPPHPRKLGDPAGIVHVVRRGESLSGIAQAHRVKLAQLAAWNKLSSNARLRTGQALRVYSLADISGGEPVTYRVRKGDSLHRIAQHFKVSVGDLRRWNHLDDDDLRPGRQLTLLLAEPLTSSL